MLVFINIRNGLNLIRNLKEWNCPN